MVVDNWLWLPHTRPSPSRSRVQVRDTFDPSSDYTSSFARFGDGRLYTFATVVTKDNDMLDMRFDRVRNGGPSKFLHSENEGYKAVCKSYVRAWIFRRILVCNVVMRYNGPDRGVEDGSRVQSWEGM